MPLSPHAAELTSGKFTQVLRFGNRNYCKGVPAVEQRLYIFSELVLRGFVFILHVVFMYVSYGCK
jgi:hypothetical protein